MSVRLWQIQMKCAVCAVVGRPSVGKSTLVNTICEAKVSIVSPFPQTTRNAIRGVYTDSRGQLVFTDTPGWHVSEKSFNRRLLSVVEKALEGCDLVLYVADALRMPGEEERSVCGMLAGMAVPVVCCINKTDSSDEKQLRQMKAFLENAMPGRKIFEVSALEDRGIDDLLIELFALSPEGELLYDEETRTAQNPEFRVAEIIREKAMNSVRDEIPHAVYVEVQDMEYRPDSGKIWIRATVNVERESQKGILVGRGGENVRKIRKEAFRDIKKIFPALDVELDIRVRVRPGWKKNEMTLNGIFRETAE